MNGAGTQKRRSLRLSHEGSGENEPPAKKSRVNGAQTKTVGTKEQDGDSNAVARRKPKKDYDQEVDGFAFTKGRKGRKAAEKAPPVRNSASERPATPPPAPPTEKSPERAAASKEDVAPLKTGQRKPRRRFPTTPEREAAEKPVRRSKRLSSENQSSDPPQASPHKPAHAKSHANHDRSPSPEKVQPVTVEKKRKRGANGTEEEEKVMRIALPFQDTPIIRRNKEFRKSSAEGQRRSSSGMRGRRASSLIDEGRGNGTYEAGTHPGQGSNSGMLFDRPSKTVLSMLNRGLPFEEDDAPIFGSLSSQPSELTSPVTQSFLQAHTFSRDTFADNTFPGTALPHIEVPTAEFFKHISADLTEPRRMRCLLGWCGTRALPSKPEPPKQSTPDANLEFQALQAGMLP